MGIQLKVSNNYKRASMNSFNEERRIQQLERENIDLRRQLGLSTHNDNPHMTHHGPTPHIHQHDQPSSYEKMIQYNEQLEKEAADLYQQLLDQFGQYKQLTSVHLECSFKDKYLNLLKKSQRARK